MNYYEEFGVPPTASPDEIRQSHKRLVRLFHPDRLQDDPEVCRLAECQMKRLNAMYSVLSDPERRREYDFSLKQEAAAVVVPHLPSPERSRPAVSRGRNLVWGVAAAACLMALYGLFASYPGRPQRPAGPIPSSAPELEASRASPDARPLEPPRRSRTTSAGARESGQGKVAPAEQESEDLRRALKQAEAQRDAALAQVAKLKQNLNENTSDTMAAPAPVADITPLDRASSASPAAAATGRLVGTWFYVPQLIDFASKDMYPPEYIDLVVTEESGIVRGRYWARYRVADRAISPEVFFRFQGEANETGMYSWAGRGGARGEVRLRLISDETLQVAWLASELGQQMGLSSGTAVLIRQKRPERH
jgi:curved DNA-binding protein CbpA